MRNYLIIYDFDKILKENKGHVTHTFMDLSIKYHLSDRQIQGIVYKFRPKFTKNDTILGDYKLKVKENILNDIDRDIINLYLCVSENLDKLINEAYWLPKARDIFEIAKEECGKEIKREELPNFKRAALYYYMIRRSLI